MKLLCLLLLLMPAVFQGVPQTQVPASVSGTVTHSGSGESVNGVRILLKVANTSQIVSSDELGRFEFANVPPGEIQIGLAEENLGAFLPIKQMGDPLRLVVEAGQRIEKVKLVVKTGGIVSGNLVTSDGAPAVGTAVDVVRPAYDVIGRCRVDSVANTRTDDRGYYRIFGLAPGAYYVRADNFAPIQTGRRTRTFFPGTMDFAKAQTVSVVDEHETDRVNFVISKSDLTHISATLVFETPPTLELNSQIEIRKLDGCDPGTNGGSTNFSTGVTPGFYEIAASVAPPMESSPIAMVNLFFSKLNLGAASTEKLSSGRIQVQLTGQGEETLTIKLRQLVPWSGQVIFAEGSSAIAFDLLRAVIAYPPGFYPNGRLDSQGRFAMPTRTDERQYVSIDGLPGNAYVKDVRSGNRSVFDEGLDVIGPGPALVAIVLDSHGGSIAGILRNSLGNALPFARAVLIPTEHRSNPILYKVATTDQDGDFHFRGIMPGNYKIFAWESVPENAWHNREFLVPYEALGTIVQVLPGTQLVKIEVPLIHTDTGPRQ